MTRTSIGIATAMSAALAAGCVAQAGEEYLGEPLLRMRGQVTTTGLTITPAVTPALCFPEVGTATLNLEALPEEVQAAFENSFFSGGSKVARIMDVQVEGVFPAEFRVNVYSPPPTAALEPLIPGEPPSVRGSVCAVQAEHDAVVEAVSAIGSSACPESSSAPCNVTNVVMTVSGSRYYVQSQSCPMGAASADECTVTRGGDVALLSETGGYEQVVAQVYDPELVYLAAPAPAGSYTAYKLGATDGLPAGYHLVRAAPPLAENEQQEWVEQMEAVRVMALAETNAQHGTNYEDELLLYLDGTKIRTAPADVVSTYRRAQARLEMELVPIQERELVSPSAPGLTLELREDANWLDLLPPPPRGPGEP
jgi:hypothetical protein